MSGPNTGRHNHYAADKQAVCVQIAVECKNQEQDPPCNEATGSGQKSRSGFQWFFFWHAGDGKSGDDWRHVLEASWDSNGKPTVKLSVKKTKEFPPTRIERCLGHLEEQHFQRFQLLAQQTMPLPLSSVLANHREWVARVAQTAAAQGLLDKEDVLRGIMTGVRENWPM